LKYRLYVFLFVVAVFVMGSCAFAHDGSFYWTFNDLNQISEDHHEPLPDGPFKGFAFVYVTNSTGIAWTDFHFAINNGPGVTIGSSPAPTSSLLNYTWNIGGAQNTLDYYFASNPVAPGSGVTFTFYTDNTANKNALFGVCGYPTVPEPTSLLVLSTGLMGLIGLARRKR
jgi:hypothetical protein